MISDITGRKILVIDDDPELLLVVECLFSPAGVQVYTATNGQEGLRQFYTYRPDLVILDIMMPIMDGWETFRRIRQLSDVPVIILTALGQDQEIIRGLNEGADDYIAKPFNPKVLMARVRTILRRAELPSTLEKQILYSDDYLTIDLGQYRVLVGGKPVKLTTTEYRLLAYLFQNAGQVLTFQQILESIWGWEYRDNIDYIHVYISRLRQKLEKDPKNPEYLLTEHGMGYRFVKQTSNETV